MRILVFLFIMMLSGVALHAQGSLRVTVKKIEGGKGSVRVGLFTNEKSFLKSPYLGRIASVEGEEATVVFESLPDGEYGISVFHDENDNERLDTNFIGIPKEGLGFGNNATGTFGPPSFHKSKVVIKGNAIEQVISLKYY